LYTNGLDSHALMVSVLDL